MDGQLGEGHAFGDFEILSVVGAGGMGVVYKARQRSLGRVVALKVIRPDVAEDPEFQARFLREAQLAASVDHPHVVTVHDAGETDGRLYLAMQWIDGQDLQHILHVAGWLAPERAVRVVAQLAGALDAVHAAGLVHRDVKPGNVLIRRIGDEHHAYLTDFGVARLTDHNDGLTRSGSVVGTAGYMAPEQIQGGEPSPRSDLYALGCLFFEAISGEPPFQSDNELALRWAHANDPRPLLSPALSSGDKRFDTFIVQSLAIDPNQRYASGRAFAKALVTAYEHKTADESTAATVEAASTGADEPHPRTAIGPATPVPSGQANLSRATPPAYGYVTPAPAATSQQRARIPLVLVALALVAVTGIAVGGFAVAGGFTPQVHTIAASAAATTTSQTVRTQTTTRPAPATRAPTTATHTHARATPASPPLTTGSSTTPAPRASTTTTGTVPGSPSPYGTDTNGYNVGPGCSDDPASSLSGCSDAPSTPSHDPTGSCPNGVTVDSQTTTCGLAEGVYTSYTSDGPVSAISPKTGQSYTFDCQTGGSGTTGDTICLSQAGAAPLYLRWHQ